MKKPKKPGWYWTTDTMTGESVYMWWNGVRYMDQDEVAELGEREVEPDTEDGEDD
jgi:hypothetical protein